MLNRQKGSGKSSAFCLLLLVFDLIRLYVFVNMEEYRAEGRYRHEYRVKYRRAQQIGTYW